MGVIESRSVDEYDPPAIQNKLLRLLDLGCARLKVVPNFEIRPACLIYELEVYSSGVVTINRMISLLYRRFPAPSNSHYAELDS